jgi:hypothetical protein
LKKHSINIKNIICLALSFCIYSSSLAVESAEKKVYKAQIQEDNLRDIFLKLVPDTLIDADLNIPGDFFSVVVTKPSAQLLQIPAGSRLIGKVVEIKKAKSFNRGGELKSEVEQVMLPDGTLIKAHAILSAEAGMQDMDKPSTEKKILKSIVKKSSELTASTMVGAVDSIQYLGLGTAISTHGISTAIGAGIGLGLGAIGALKAKGESIEHSVFSAMNFKLESDFELLEELPFSKGELEKLIQLEELGIDLQIVEMQKHFSKQFGDFVVINMKVTNNSKEDIYLGDFVLGSDLHIKPVLANPLLSSQSLNKLNPKESIESKIAFSLGEYKEKENYRVYLLNPLDQTIVANTKVQLLDYL